MNDNDELAARIRSLEAERLRPIPPPPERTPRLDPVAISELCEVLAEALEDDPETDEGAA